MNKYFDINTKVLPTLPSVGESITLNTVTVSQCMRDMKIKLSKKAPRYNYFFYGNDWKLIGWRPGKWFDIGIKVRPKQHFSHYGTPHRLVGKVLQHATERMLKINHNENRIP